MKPSIKFTTAVVAACMLILTMVPPLAAQEHRAVGGRVRDPAGQPIAQKPGHRRR